MAPITKKRHILESFNSFNTLAISSNNNSSSSGQYNQSIDSKDSSPSPSPYSSKSPVIVSPVSVSLPVIQPPLQSKLAECSLSTSHHQINSCGSNSNGGYNENNNHHMSPPSPLDDSKHSMTPSPMSSMALSPQYARVNRVVLDKNSDEYRKRRERNNIAVKKSRWVLIVHILWVTIYPANSSTGD